MGNPYLDEEELINERGSDEASAEPGEQVQHVQQEMDCVNVLRCKQWIKRWKCFKSLF